MIKTRQTTNNTTYIFKAGAIVEVKRHGNDIWGNPLYKVFPINFLGIHSNKAYKNYLNAIKPYYLMQSYNIESDIGALLDDITKRKQFPPFSLELLEAYGYKDVKTLNA